MAVAELSRPPQPRQADQPNQPDKPTKLSTDNKLRLFYDLSLRTFQDANAARSNPALNKQLASDAHFLRKALEEITDRKYPFDIFPDFKAAVLSLPRTPYRDLGFVPTSESGLTIPLGPNQRTLERIMARSHANPTEAKLAVRHHQALSAPSASPPVLTPDNPAQVRLLTSQAQLAYEMRRGDREQNPEIRQQAGLRDWLEAEARMNSSPSLVLPY